mmetsp:Transcript_5826/g.9320  ORF Transcript_5826/g.9320 Transcript_5826/m.9320 type:complete len:203 (+) Transcript_5826:2270-2878(+)
MVRPFLNWQILDSLFPKITNHFVSEGGGVGMRLAAEGRDRSVLLGELTALLLQAGLLLLLLLNEESLRVNIDLPRLFRSSRVMGEPERAGDVVYDRATIRGNDIGEHETNLERAFKLLFVDFTSFVLLIGSKEDFSCVGHQNLNDRESEQLVVVLVNLLAVLEDVGRNFELLEPSVWARFSLIHLFRGRFEASQDILVVEVA